MSSLFNACKYIVLSGTQDIGGHIIPIELLYEKNNIDIINDTFLGNTEQNSICLIKTKDFTNDALLTVASPKKSLVIYCDKFINNGTISMTGKGPNVLPHNYHIAYSEDGFDEDVIIPAYANNAVPGNTTRTWSRTGVNGNNGTNRQCGSGGTGSINSNNQYGDKYVGASGSGYAFGGGAGSGGVTGVSSLEIHNVDPIYPMCGGNGYSYTYYAASGGVGIPAGGNSALNTFWNYNTSGTYMNAQNIGVGGRIIIFCNEFTNNGIIEANGIGTALGKIYSGATGGASGGGAIDIFFKTIHTQGTITANGGIGGTIHHNGITTGTNGNYRGGNGGNGCVTLSYFSGDIDVIESLDPSLLSIPSLKNTNIYKNPEDQHLFDLSDIGTIIHKDRAIKINQEKHYFQVGDVLYYNVKTNLFNKAVAVNNIASEVCGVVSKVIDSNNFVLIAKGKIETDKYTFDENTPLYLSSSYPGKLTDTSPQNVIKQVGYQLIDGIMVDIQRGYYMVNSSQTKELEPYTQEELDEIIKNIW